MLDFPGRKQVNESRNDSMKQSNSGSTTKPTVFPVKWSNVRCLQKNSETAVTALWLRGRSSQ